MTSSQPLITVIIPVYNVAKLLERCVKSVLAQTYSHLEIILVDDGSTDMSGAFCDVFAKQDSRIKVIHQKNQGLSAARNAALEFVQGEFVTFVDSDDAVHPQMIETLHRLCEQHQTKMSICSFSEVYDHHLPSAQPVNAPTLLLNTTSCLVTMLCEQDFSMSAWGKLYARLLFQGVRFPVGKLYEDVGTTYKLVLKCSEVAFTPAPLYYYYQNQNSITQQAFSMQKLDLLTLTDQMCDDLTSWSKTRPESDQRQIANLVRKRRMHARFSILRQMVMVDPDTLPSPERKNFLNTRQEIVQYLRHHRQDILKNPLASRRDQLAMRSLQLGLPVFKFAWQKYASKHKTA